MGINFTATFFDQQAFLDLFDRLLPESYLSPIKTIGPGYESFQAFADIGQRISAAINNIELGNLISSANGGVFATGNVDFFRSTIDGSVVIPARINGLTFAGVASTTLSATISSTQTTPIAVISTAGFPSSGFIKIVLEYIAYTSTTPTSFVGITRGVFGSFVQGYIATTTLNSMQSIIGFQGISPTAVGNNFVKITNPTVPSNQGTFRIMVVTNPTDIFVDNAGGNAQVKTNLTWAEYQTVTVKSGTVVTTSRSNRDFATTSDAVFTPLDLGPKTVSVQAVAAGWEWNVQGQVITAANEVLPGEVDTVKFPVQNPPYGDPNIQVRQITDITGGMAPMLEQLAADRGITRQSNESDDSLRQRTKTLPDTISPGAIQRTSNTFLQPVGGHDTFIEPWGLSYQTCWDAPSSIGIVYPPNTPADLKFDTNTFVFDDPRPPVPFKNRWLDESDVAGTFILLVSNIVTINELGMAFDDPAITAFQLQSIAGKRAFPAFDIIQTFSVTEPFLDGTDIQKNAVYSGLYELMQAIKAAGIKASLELEGN